MSLNETINFGLLRDFFGAVWETAWKWIYGEEVALKAVRSMKSIRRKARTQTGKPESPNKEPRNATKISLWSKKSKN